MNKMSYNPYQDIINSYISPFLSQTLNSGSVTTERINNRGRRSIRQNNIPVHMTKSNSSITIYAEMPGFDKDSINLDFNENELLISGTKKAPEINEDEKVTDMSTIKYGNFKTTVHLPIHVVEEEKVVVKYENGLLKITVHKDLGHNFSLRLNE